ncbi:unnamed protein product [Caenorhabditis angaria]|uniref:Innexin n=1 Tax=Caenorhabditis angaria TaxID=860376 RepID=A0A9P1IYN3_9PELO|nr:unnamed protein product [Caenorhabditis angaria]
MIGVLLPYIRKFQRSAESNDLIDRINYQYTSTILGFSAVMMAASQYIGKPIQCWVPAQFTRMWEKYAETYCFIKGTYFLPNDTLANDYYFDKDATRVGYYQWIPMVLFFQAFLFFLPSIIWKMFNESCELKIKELAAVSEQSRKVKSTLSDDKTKSTRFAKYFFNKLVFRNESEVFKKSSSILTSGKFLPLLFIGTKVLYAINILVQFFILTYFLETKNMWWGYETFLDLLNGREWESTGLFPRVTMCDFAVMQLDAIHNHTIQCVIVFNMLAEKVYIFFWFWLVVVGAMTFISLFYWVFTFFLSSVGRNFVFAYLSGTETYEDEQEKGSGLADRFVDRFLTSDGVFISRLVQQNSGDLFVANMIEEMFALYKQREEEKASKKNDDLPQSKKLEDELPSPQRAVSENLTSEDEDEIDSPDTTATLPR